MKQKNNKKYASIKIQFYIVTFLFFLKQCTTDFSKLSSFKFMRLSDCTFLNIENDSPTSHEVTGAYLSEEIWDKVSLYYFIEVSKHTASCVFSFNFLAFLSISPFFVCVCLSLFLSHSFIRENINKMQYYAS